ncbi:transporter substrate-binding domain-containing protein [Legionella maioricensis]|uniref:Transporter substrate-binding domain-containing protein n=1 Tax=Legionella maioricensis TaxID=2896528 RepID=A0A9X2D0P3_9GAMM|nr:transporter substrate-binding domain-containing protein [Legionella maioricensis]MCL9683955.1 transporter substrate-binding domain-containing protein [Legionella maioricensis]MCL9688279.1 transporter substrate-binding domain-containing protein [Legionella maioricensis]
MNFIRRLLITFVFFISPLYAQGEPLNVGVESFSPPFIIQGTDREVYGYDIDMMNSLCKIMNRTCRFHIMQFDKLLTAVAEKKIDVAVSSITITLDRLKQVDFSMPYLLSYSRFLTNHLDNAKKPFSLNLLNAQRIGIETGTIFGDQIGQMGIINPTIKEYETMELLVEALGKNEVDYILLDNPTAIYWEANASGEFSVIGPTFLYGNGFGIALNKDNKTLLQAINSALLQYENSEDYKINYNKYLEL